MFPKTKHGLPGFVTYEWVILVKYILIAYLYRTRDGSKIPVFFDWLDHIAIILNGKLTRPLKPIRFLVSVAMILFPETHRIVLMISPDTIIPNCIGRCSLKSDMYLRHYSDVIMDTIASQITSLTIVYSTVYSDADQRKHQSSTSLAIVRGIHRGPVNSSHKWPVTRKMFPFDDVIMEHKSTSDSSLVNSNVFLEWPLSFIGKLGLPYKLRNVSINFRFRSFLINLWKKSDG